MSYVYIYFEGVIFIEQCKPYELNFSQSLILLNLGKLHLPLLVMKND